MIFHELPKFIYVWSQMEKCRLMSVLEKYYVLIQQFAVCTLVQFVGSFESSVVLKYSFALNVTNHS